MAVKQIPREWTQIYFLPYVLRSAQPVQFWCPKMCAEQSRAPKRRPDVLWEALWIIWKNVGCSRQSCAKTEVVIYCLTAWTGRNASYSRPRVFIYFYVAAFCARSVIANISISATLRICRRLRLSPCSEAPSITTASAYRSNSSLTALVAQRAVLLVHWQATWKGKADETAPRPFPEDSGARTAWIT